MVPMAGLEPARREPLPPQDSVSTSSTTSANKIDWDHHSAYLQSVTTLAGLFQALFQQVLLLAFQQVPLPLVMQAHLQLYPLQPV